MDVPPDDYWRQSRRPLASLLFVLPLLALYEVGVLLLDREAIHNGAAVWLRQLLDLIGFGQYYLLPLLTVAVLLGWHHVTGQPWRVRGGVLYGMFVECAVLGCVLMVIAQVQGALFQLEIGEGRTAIARWIALLVSYFGAGVYEETLFRLILLPLVAGLVRLAGASVPVSFAVAALATSLLFAGAHYVGQHGEVFGWYSFTFRFSAGMIFAGLFCYRGFGIAVGTHALYDIFVGLW